MIHSKDVVQGVTYGTDMTIKEVMETVSEDSPEDFVPKFIIMLNCPSKMDDKQRIKQWVSVAAEMMRATHQFAKNIPDEDMAPDFKQLFHGLENTLGYLEGCSSSVDFKEMMSYDDDEFKRRSYK